MFIRSFLAKQLGFPTGIFGRLLMRLLNRGNATMNDLTLEQIALQSGEKVLEIGFGGGYLLDQMAATKIPSFIVGVDPAIEVIHMGSKKFQSQIAQGYIELKQASGESLSYDDHSFNCSHLIKAITPISWQGHPRPKLSISNKLSGVNGINTREIALANTSY